VVLHPLPRPLTLADVNRKIAAIERDIEMREKQLRAARRERRKWIGRKNDIKRLMECG
jgi:hypothetical protein